MGCDVYWGSHGCELARGHEGAHLCGCECESHPDPDSGCVCGFPYYGWRTVFYGDDAPGAQAWFNEALGMDCPRQCPKCRLAIGDGPDPCLGWIPGAVGACCGHGEEGGYVMFLNADGSYRQEPVDGYGREA
jgi:hypothetical protein